MVKNQCNVMDGKILTLPKFDFPSLLLGNTNNKGTSSSDNDDNEVDPPLLLFSLPPSLELKDLETSVFFLSDDCECRLVNESKGITFDLIKVESSNAYVMFPPPSKRAKKTEAKTCAENDCDDDNNKLRGRLLRETNTFFVECEKPKANLKQLITEHLRENCIYPPSKGVSIRELSHMFKFSKKEVKNVIDHIDAFQIPIEKSENDDFERKYGVLSEEVERDTFATIIAVLSEWDGAIDYAQKGVALDEMIKVIMAKDDDILVKGVVRNCLGQCILVNSENDNDNEIDSPLVRLDPKVIAKKLAHQLFNSRLAPWRQSHFLSEWHRLMPGVGKEYEPSIDLLKGIAISVENITPIYQDEISLSNNSSDEMFWKYFPKDLLPASDDDRFKMLFKEKNRWTFEELQSYFDETKFESLLLKYTTRHTDENLGTWYEGKQIMT